MSDLDDELAALEKEVENEKKMANKNTVDNKNINNNNINMNYGKTYVANQPKNINYDDFGDNSNGLENFALPVSAISIYCLKPKISL